MTAGAWLAVGALLFGAVLSLVAPRSPAATVAVATRPENPFRGLGTWVDMYSWSETFTQGHPSVGPADIDAMAARGVQTLYLQAASQTGPAAVLEPTRLLALIKRAQRRGLSVVAWYLPRLVDPADDLRRLDAISRLPIQGVGIDIESLDVADIGRRNAALVSLSRQLHNRLAWVPVGAIVLAPSLLEVVNPNLWPAFPWRAIAPDYDAWLPMSYWTGRLTSSGLRDGFRYTEDNIRRLRVDLGLPSAVVNPIGGLTTDSIGPGQVGPFVLAVKECGCAGGSLYEWGTTNPAAWAELKALRR